MVNEPNIEDELEDNEEGEQGESDSNMQALLQEVREFAPTMTATSWLDIPRVFMDPPLIPTSTDLARVVDKRELLTTSATVLTLFARGGTCMPEHFNKMLSFLSLLNRNVHNLTGFVAQTPRTTLNMAPRGKVQVPTGVLLKTTGTPAVLVQHEANFVQTDAPILTADAMAAAQLQEAPVYSLQELCTVEWGIIPFRYKTVDEEEVRDVFQVLKVLPCHGFDLVSFVYSIASSTIKMSRTLDTEFEEACKLLTQIVYQEMINLNMSAYLFPDPLTSESPFAPTSIVNIMSPFLVLRKMLQHIPGGFCGPDQHSNGIQQDTLEIHGIPSLQTSLDASATIDMYDRMHRKYIEFISSWSAGVKIQSRAVTRMPELLFKDRRFVVFDCAIDLKLYPLFKEQKDLVTRKIVFPLIVSTLLTNFKFVYHGSADRWYEIREAYVVAQCGAEQTPLTPLALQRLSNSHASYPEAGLFMGLRKAMDRLLCNADVAEDVDIYVQYLRYCQTVCTEQQIDGFYISERVRHCAQVLRRAAPSINDELVAALSTFSLSLSNREDQILQNVLHDELMHTTFLVQRTFCAMNKWTKATAINLSLVYASVVSDILCFLGMDNNSWTWTFYPMLVCGGGGHLRALTEDGHAQRSECVYLAKASSVGFNAVVISTMNAIMSLITNVFPDLPVDAVATMQLKKIDRVSRVAIEEFGAIMSVNQQVFQTPDKNVFMCSSSFDEWARNVNEDGLNGLITSAFARDKSGGGTTHKSAESRTKGPREKQETHILRGMSLFSLLQAQNRNASNAIMAEALKALITGAVACFVPSAQPSPGFPSASDEHQRKKHRCNIHDSCDAAGEIQMPSDSDDLRNLTWVLNIVPMNCRNIGLLNKMAMTQINVNDVEQQLYKWFGGIVWNYLRPFLGATLSLSFWRVMNGYLSRAVASSLYIDNVLTLTQNTVYDTANHETIAHMESGIGIHSLNNALLDGLSHMLDFNLIVANKIIAHKLKTPVLSVEFLRALFNEEHQLNTRFPNEAQALKFWLTSSFMASNEECRLQHGFVHIKDLGTKTDYKFFELYLENYCSIVLDSYHTYQQCFVQSARVFDLSNLFSLELSMLKCRFHGLGLPTGIDTMSDSNLANVQPTFIYIEKQERSDKLHVHIAQHLLLTALMGPAPLHSDNVYSIGKTLYKLLMSELAVQQALPNGMLCHSFEYHFGHVVPSYISTTPTRHYMARSRRDISAWMHGKSTELCGFLDVHPIEDVMHVGSWLHYARVFKCASSWRAQPFPPLRSFELVPGRKYPLQSEEHGNAVLCICPQGQNHVKLNETSGGARVFDLSTWNLYVVYERKYQVAPLVFRPNAAVYTRDRLGIIVAWESEDDVPVETERRQRDVVRRVLPYNYLNYEGCYNVLGADGTARRTHWTEVHRDLLPLGTHVYVKRVDEMRTPRQCEYVRGWLRYPDESVTESNDRIVYVAFRVATSDETYDDTAIRGFAIEDCALAIAGTNFCDYVLAFL